MLFFLKNKISQNFPKLFFIDVKKSCLILGILFYFKEQNSQNFPKLLVKEKILFNLGNLVLFLLAHGLVYFGVLVISATAAAAVATAAATAVRAARRSLRARS